MTMAPAEPTRRTLTQLRLHLTISTILLVIRSQEAAGCQFFPAGEYLRFVRVPESLPVGGEVLRVQVHPRRNLMLQALDRDEDASFFTWRDLNRTHVSVVLAHSLEELVDSESPQNVLKFRLGCDSSEGNDTISSFLSVTVYVEDVNDHSPLFLGAPYHITVDELTPAGLTIFRGIQAVDRDKPNTPNSDVQFTISDSGGRFSLESSHRPALLLARPLDYDKGDHNFTLTITASDRGSPPRSSETTLSILVQDNDDLGPKFTQQVYRTNVTEFFPLTATRIHQLLNFAPPIGAFDQDRGLDAILRYDIVAGNDRHLFSMDTSNATLFLNKEIDLDAETLSGNTFVLHVQASQVDNPLKTAAARVEVEILDINDNLPEFEVDFYNISIVENLPNGFSVLQVMATDRDQGDNAEFLYQLQDPYGAFSIDPRSGWLTVRDQSILDREQHSSLKMKVYAKEKKESVVGKYEKYYRKSKKRRFPTTTRPFRNTRVPNTGTGTASSTSTQPSVKTTYVFPDKTGFGDLVNVTPNSSEILSYVNVEVTLLDANDNNPVFVPSNLYEFSIKSSAKVGDLIGKLMAVDPDLARNGLVSYDLQRSSNLTVTSPFLLEPQTGILRVAESPLPLGRHALFIEAADQPANPSERRFSLAVASVDVLPSVRVHKPTTPDFIGAPYEFWVGANVGVGTSIGQIRINDAMDKEHIIYDLLHSYSEGVPFAVEERSGTITVVEDPTKFRRILYDFEAVVTQDSSGGGRPLATLVTNVTVHVVDPEDERGILMKGANSSPIEFRVRENLAGAVIGRVLYQNRTNFLTKNASRSIRFIIANQQDVTDDISIGEDGILYTKRALDRERRDIYRLTLIAEYSKGPISGAGIYQVTIYVDDENDNAPIFNHNSFEGSIKENAAKGTVVNMNNAIEAKDADLETNAIFTYSLSGDGHEVFRVDRDTGKVVFTGDNVDRENKDIYELWVTAKDKGNLSSEAKLVIRVLDVNDNSPVITKIFVPLVDQNLKLVERDQMNSIRIFDEKYPHNELVTDRETDTSGNKLSTNNINSYGPLLAVPESIALGTKLMRIVAEDLDTGNNGHVKYAIKSELVSTKLSVSSEYLYGKQYFVVNENTGDIIVSRALPPESEFRINITAEDGGGKYDSLNVTISVKDVNNHAPIFEKSWYTFDIEEAIYSRSVLGKIEAKDSDYGRNANVSYEILHKGDFTLPFEISTFSGILSVNGELDRERNEFFTFTVTAKDDGLEKSLTSSVTVDVHVLDVNDNSPRFYGYNNTLRSSHAVIPVYRTALNENSPIGTKVVQVYANDSDFPGNGNGLLLFDIPRRKNQQNIFLIDSKDGTITTSTKLNYENAPFHNITVTASDLGSPSLTSTALVMVEILDVSETFQGDSSFEAVFTERYYEIEIEENSHTPVELLTLNTTDQYKHTKLRYFIVNEDETDIKRIFVLDPRNGTLFLVRSPDRELRDIYNIIVRAERPKIGRNLPHMIYPVPEEDLSGLTKWDVKIVVKIKDVNDNSPRFAIHGRPIVTAITTTTKFGYEILTLQATDPDLGLNGEVRYQLLSDHSQRFSMDPVTGQVKTAASFVNDAGKVFGFDVKATDRRGADDGKSAIANVFVYVLDERREVVLAVEGGPLQVQAAERNITTLLGVVTGLDVRVRRLEPQGNSGTDTHIHIYAVDPVSNSVVDMDNLQRALVLKQQQLEHSLPGLRVIRAGTVPIGEKARAASLRPLQLGALVAGAALLLAAMATALCIVCFKKNKRMRHRAFSQQRLSALGLGSSSLKVGGGLFPGGDGVRLYGDLVDEMQETVCPHGRSVEQFGLAHQQCVRNQMTTEPPSLPPRTTTQSKHHEPSCVRFNRRTTTSKRKVGGMETSITSVHSSGQDSGIAEGPCPCGLSTSQEEEESSNGSYEDSLKSSHRERASSRSLKYQRPDTVNVAARPLSLHSSMVRRQPQSHSRRRARQRRGSAGAAPPPPLHEPTVDYDQSETEDIGSKSASHSRLLHLSQPSLSTLHLSMESYWKT